MEFKKPKKTELVGTKLTKIIGCNIIYNQIRGQENLGEKKQYKKKKLSYNGSINIQSTIIPLV